VSFVRFVVYYELNSLEAVKVFYFDLLLCDCPVKVIAGRLLKGAFQRGDWFWFHTVRQSTGKDLRAEKTINYSESD
jgi:hypothetical protein